jgi:hypothetical protein
MGTQSQVETMGENEEGERKRAVALHSYYLLHYNFLVVTFGFLAVLLQ